MKKYLLVQRNYEYNDEIYSETEGSNPILIFADKTIAEKTALKYNKEWFSKNNLNDYCYNIKDALPYRSFHMAIEQLKDVGISYVEEKNYSSARLILPENLTDKQVKVLVDVLSFPPAYYVEEVDYVE